MSAADLSGVRRVAVVGNHEPRRCGIATFTSDVVRSLISLDDPPDVVTLAMSDRPQGYEYPERVSFEIREDCPADYLDAAEYVNTVGVDAVLLQHEYGIYGGPSGAHVLDLLRELRCPVVTTLHTVLADPTEEQRGVMRGLAKLSDRFCVMSERAVSMLGDIYGVERERVDMIHHGIPDVPFEGGEAAKAGFGLRGRRVLLTFGLLSPGKGIEHAIDAMPGVVRGHPDAVYVVLGATHPHIRANSGESYRESLQERARRLGVEDHVRFENRFVDLAELTAWIAAADIYVTPYLNEAQITSGTLAYTVGAGKAVVSTPYWHAQELLADGRGRLVPFRDPGAIARSVRELLDDPEELLAVRRRSYELGREMIWPRFAERQMQSLACAAAQRVRRPRAVKTPKASVRLASDLPAMRLDHLRRLTDDTGLLQHAEHLTARFEDGYCLDDNARGLMLTTRLEAGGGEWAETAGELTPRYLAFVRYALDNGSGVFRNFMGFDRRWLEREGSEDSQGRAVWALGELVRHSPSVEHRRVAQRMLRDCREHAASLTSPRARAFTLLGLSEASQATPGDLRGRRLTEEVGERLAALFGAIDDHDWLWPEDVLSYDNAALPHALIAAGESLEREDWIRLGVRSLRWLCRAQTGEAGHFRPVGCDGWWRRGEAPARFDQQPLEAHSTVAACVRAYRVTGDSDWLSEADRAFDWFLGRNDIGAALADPATGACLDGLERGGVNRNAGAESTLAYLLGLEELQRARAELLGATTEPPVVERVAPGRNRSGSTGRGGVVERSA